MACSVEKDVIEDNLYDGVLLNLSTLPEYFTVGETVTVTVSPTGEYDSSESLPITYVWNSTDNSVATVSGEGATAEITALSEGRCVIYVYVEEQPSLMAKATVEIQHMDDGIIRILAIGNSFSQDAVEQYLYELFADDGQEVIIGNLYIGGCSLEKHLTNIENDNSVYEYRKIEDGIKTNYRNVSVSYAIDDESWDYVSIQQVSGLSGLYEECTPYLPGMIAYIRGNTREDTRLAWHQTWAYASDSGHSDFSRYYNDQDYMYAAIADVSEKVMENYGFDLLIPSGTAIQNGRTSSIGDDFDRDGYHLETTYGRFTAACTWYEAISGHNATDNSYSPSSVGALQEKIAKTAAHLAVSSPYAVTQLEL